MAQRTPSSSSHHVHNSDASCGHWHAPASESVVQDNVAHFDHEAHRYEDLLGTRELARRICRAMRTAYDFDEESTSILDFGCGIGLLSRELAPYSKEIVGVDVSRVSVEEYNVRVANQGIARDEMRAVAADLRGEPGELDDRRFDVVLCAMAYHHLHHPDQITRVLAHFLKPGGTILVVDLMARQDSTPVIPERFGHIVPHRHGFSEESMRSMFEGASLQSFQYKTVFYGRVPTRSGLGSISGVDRRVNFFLAVGKKKFPLSH